MSLLLKDVWNNSLVFKFESESCVQFQSYHKLTYKVNITDTVESQNLEFRAEFYFKFKNILGVL